MAGGASVTVIGADRVASTLHELADDLRHLDPAHHAAGNLIARQAAANVRRRTGALAASIAVTVGRDGPTVTAGNGGVRYAGPIEGGWRRHGIEPQRYMGRALTERRPDVVEEYVDAVTRAASHVKGA